LIPHLAHTLKAAVTIIGTVGRTGISGALIGNTAEVILDAVDSDVLVLKPQTLMDHLEELATKA
jgi:nucleotide-binding universal stress UspA family protein